MLAVHWVALDGMATQGRYCAGEEAEASGRELVGHAAATTGGHLAPIHEQLATRPQAHPQG
jgi:hypothetical protein